MTAFGPSFALFDTPLILSFRAAEEPACGFVERWIAGGRGVTVSEITALVLLARSKTEDDRTRQVDFLTQSRVLPIKVKASERATAMMMSLGVPSPLTADDALVAATALIEKLPLYSLDPERYAAVPGLTALPAR